MTHESDDTWEWWHIRVMTHVSDDTWEWWHMRNKTNKMDDTWETGPMRGMTHIIVITKEKKTSQKEKIFKKLNTTPHAVVQLKIEKEEVILMSFKPSLTNYLLGQVPVLFFERRQRWRGMQSQHKGPSFGRLAAAGGALGRRTPRAGLARLCDRWGQVRAGEFWYARLCDRWRQDRAGEFWNERPCDREIKVRAGEFLCARLCDMWGQVRAWEFWHVRLCDRWWQVRAGEFWHAWLCDWWGQVMAGELENQSKIINSGG